MSGPRVGLVLGAGGERGWDWTAGCLLALADHCGFDGRRAEQVVGTSVGSLIGGYLGHGTSVEQLCRHVGGPPDPMAPRWPVLPIDLTQSRAGSLALGPRRLIGHLVGRSVRGHRSLPPVGVEMESRLGVRSWPMSGLRIVAWDRVARERHVLSADGDLDLVQSVDASCAVPGVYPAVEVGDVELVDGGVHSMTNADLVDPELDVVVVIAPSLLGAGRVRTPGLLARWSHLVTLRSEIAGRDPSTVVTLAPAAGAVGQWATMDRRERVATARGEATTLLRALDIGI